jgi:hypothetical protein
LISATEQYLFDLHGFIVVRGALQDQEVARINTLIDDHGLDRPTKRTRFGRYAGFMEQDQAFRSLIDHPPIMPYLDAWVRSGIGSWHVRLDHVYFIFSEPGDPGEYLHLGGAPYIPSCSYHVRYGDVFSGLTVVSYVLNEVPAGQGGFACIPGSHKANYACPSQIAERMDKSCIVAPSVKPGDAIIFTEALTHGSLPWTASHMRRVLFYKYSPSFMTWMLPRWSQALLEQCSPAQRKILEPPHVSDEPDFF